MKQALFSTMLFAFVVSATFHSCKKEDPDTETKSAVDNNICETEFTKMHSHVNGFAINEQGIKSMMPPCPTVTPPDTTTSPGWPRTMIIDYGTAGCTDTVDGKTRKGIITLTFSNRWHLI